MVKHTQTIRRQQATNYLSVFDHFVGLTLKGLNASIWKIGAIIRLNSLCCCKNSFVTSVCLLFVLLSIVDPHLVLQSQSLLVIQLTTAITSILVFLSFIRHSTFYIKLLLTYIKIKWMVKHAEGIYFLAKFAISTSEQ